MFDGKIFARNSHKKINILVQDFVPIRTALSLDIIGNASLVRPAQS